MFVVLDRPVNRVARQAVPGCQRDEVAIFESAKAPLLSGDPHRTSPVETKMGSFTFAQAVIGTVGRLDPAILEIHQATAAPEAQPKPVPFGVVEHARGTRRVSKSRPGDPFHD